MDWPWGQEPGGGVGSRRAERPDKPGHAAVQVGCSCQAKVQNLSSINTQMLTIRMREGSGGGVFLCVVHCEKRWLGADCTAALEPSLRPALRSQSWLMAMLLGLRSRCTMFAECTYCPSWSGVGNGR